jgi:hypothetical protein
MAEIRELSEANAASCRIAAVAARENSARRYLKNSLGWLEGTAGAA